MNGPIVLGYDGSESANAALEMTVGLAKEVGAKVVVVFGYYVTPLGGQGGEDVREALERVGKHALARAEGDLGAADIEFETRLVAHKPADAILEVANEVGAGLVAVGTVGESPITGALLVQRSKLPMLVVPAKQGS